MADDMKKEQQGKKVDESWKENVQQEKDHGFTPSQEAMEVSFGVLITSLAMDAIIALGDVEHPATKKREVDLPHAKFSIDMLTVLQEKTKGNLTKEEAEALEAILYDLRMRFVAKKSGTESVGPEIVKP